MTAPSPARNSPAAFSSSVTCCMFTSFPCRLLNCNPNGLQCQAGGTPTHRIHTILGTLFLPTFCPHSHGKTGKNTDKQKSPSALLPQGKTAIFKHSRKVPPVGLEPTSQKRRILSPLRLPIPPRGLCRQICRQNHYVMLVQRSASNRRPQSSTMPSSRPCSLATYESMTPP